MARTTTSPERLRQLLRYEPETGKLFWLPRAASRSENLCNRGMSPRNTSGHKGVYFDAQSGRWRAHIKKSGRFHFLGSFDLLDEALAARRSAESTLHGEFARAA